MSDNINEYQSIGSLENYGIPTDPAARQQYEAQIRAQVQKTASEAQKAAQQAPKPNSEASLPPDQRVFLVNNMARPIHIVAGEQSFTIDGQLASTGEGPFKKVSRDSLNDNYLLQDYMTTPVSRVKGHPLYGVPRVEEISEPEFRKRHAEYLKKKVIRDAENAREATASNKHADGTVDEVDSSFELTKVNTNIIRAQGFNG